MFGFEVSQDLTFVSRSASRIVETFHDRHGEFTCHVEAERVEVFRTRGATASDWVLSVK